MNEPIYNLQYHIQMAFMDDRDMKEYGIEVLDSNGIVTLRGTVPLTRPVTELKKSSAEWMGSRA